MLSLNQKFTPSIIKVIDDHINIFDGISYDHIIYKSDVDPYWKNQDYSKFLNIHLVTIDTAVTNYQPKNVYSISITNVCDFLSCYDNGVAINGTFSENGKYITKYKDIFSKNLGKVSINNEEFISNPMLVHKFQPVKIDIEEKDDTGQPIYTCKKHNSPGENFHSCDNILPGDLYHLGNANPRTILATKDKITYFIVIVGREKEYLGATVEQMQDFLVNYLRVETAINLDGGKSSLLLWKKNGKIYTPLDNVYRKVVGNVLGYVL